MPITDVKNGDVAEIRLEDRLTFSDTSEFRKKLNGLLAQNPKSLSILLERLSFMDSAGLGMLIVTLEECKKRSISLSLRQPRGDVKQLLQATKCDERFQIVE